VRAIDQNNRLNLNGDGFDVNQIKYSESLDTTYAGAYLSIGGEYNILGYLGIGGSWGLRSLISLRAGVYDASTDYSGRFTPDGGSTTHLGLSDDQVAFIGAASFETRKQLGPRTSLSLVTDYEYYSFAPQMKLSMPTSRRQPPSPAGSTRPTSRTTMPSRCAPRSGSMWRSGRWRRPLTTSR
jgi:hypothetical protein